MSDYGNYILTIDQIDDLMEEEYEDYSSLAKGDINNAFRYKDTARQAGATPSPLASKPGTSTSTLGGTNAYQATRELWAKVLIHFNNFLAGNSSSVDLGEIVDGEGNKILAYDGSQYEGVKDLPIYEIIDGVPTLRGTGSRSTVKRRTNVILGVYKRTWDTLYNNGSSLGAIPGSVAFKDFNVYQLKSVTKEYFSGVGKIEDFKDASGSDDTGFGGVPAFTLMPDPGNYYIYRVWARLAALHTALYGQGIGSSVDNPLGGLERQPILPIGQNISGDLSNPVPIGDPVTAARLFVNIVRGIQVLFDDKQNQESLADQAFNLAQTAAQQAEAEEAADLGFTIISLPQSVKEQIVSNSNNDGNRFFTDTFNSELIAMVPLVYNFYLTSQYFSGIERAFQNPKDRVLDIILSTIANDNNFDSTPDLQRPAANSTISNATGQDQQAAFNSAARDFILKMLIKTPIDILKGLVELVDPHVAISKVIKTGTGFAFNELSGLLDEGIQSANLNQEIAVATDGFIQPNLNGDDLLTLILCAVDAAMKQIPEAPPPAPPIPENFFPRVSIDGVDFTGTVSGMLMMPPSPLGLIYLLLELLKNDVTNLTENVSNANTESANEVECTPEPQNLLPEPCDDTE